MTLAGIIGRTILMSMSAFNEERLSFNRMYEIQRKRNILFGTVYTQSNPFSDEGFRVCQAGNT